MKAGNGLLAAVMAAATVAIAPSSPAALTPGGSPPQGYYQGGQEPWAAPPSEYQDDVARRGFHDGIEGARKDADNHRRPDVNNRDEYRHPDVPGPARRTYRQAFRRGYQVGVDHLMHGR